MQSSALSRSLILEPHDFFCPSYLDTASNAPSNRRCSRGLESKRASSVPILFTPNSASFAQPKRLGRAHRATKARGHSLRAGSPATHRAVQSREGLRARWTGTHSLAASATGASSICPASSSHTHLCRIRVIPAKPIAIESLPINHRHRNPRHRRGTSPGCDKTTGV